VKRKIEPTLDILFDSPVRGRLLKMFLYDPERSFELKTISKRLNIRPALVKKHLQNLVEIKFISRKAAKEENIFRVNKDFGFYKELKALAAKISPASEEKMLKRVAGLGKVKLAVISGIFINFDNARADLLVVGENIKPAKFNKFLKDLEAETGKEINYALMTTKEFQYRYGMYDRFVRDMLDFKHKKLINKLRI